MPPVPIRLSWRTWWRVAAAVLLAFAAGVVAATDTVAWWWRIVGAAAFVVVFAAALDVVVYHRTWDVDGRRWWIPSLIARGRIIPVDDQRVVELRSTFPVRLAVTGSKGERTLAMNPLVSYRDLDRWFDRIAVA